MLVIGSWNVENLFRPGGEFGPDDDTVYRAKLSALAATIDEAAPDVLGLQEIGSAQALADLVDLLDGDWHTALAAHFDPHRPIRVGVLSRAPIDVLGEAVDFPDQLSPVQTGDRPDDRTTRMGRGALAVRVEPTPGHPLTLVVCHLKSKLLSFPAAHGGSRFAPRDEGERARYGAYGLNRRAAEAVTVRALVDQLLDGQGRTRALAVVGDLNDEPTAATTQLLSGPPGSELGTAGAARPDAGDAARLWNLAALIPDKQRFSRVYRGRGELIDHILVSHALLDRIDTVTALTDRDLPSVGDDPGERRGARDSDHAPVLATIAL